MKIIPYMYEIFSHSIPIVNPRVGGDKGRGGVLPIGNLCQALKKLSFLPR